VETVLSVSVGVMIQFQPMVVVPKLKDLTRLTNLNLIHTHPNSSISSIQTNLLVAVMSIPTCTPKNKTNNSSNNPLGANPKHNPSTVKLKTAV